MKKSTQWDIVGVFGLTLGLGTIILLFGEYLPKWAYDNPSDSFLLLVVSGVEIMFGFMCFIFGFFEGKKEQNHFNPSKR